MWTINDSGCLIGPEGEYGYAVSRSATAVQVLLTHDDCLHSEAIVQSDGRVETGDGFPLGRLDDAQSWEKITSSPG
jgi:hypothetical protein